MSGGTEAEVRAAEAHFRSDGAVIGGKAGRVSGNEGQPTQFPLISIVPHYLAPRVAPDDPLGQRSYCMADVKVGWSTGDDGFLDELGDRIRSEVADKMKADPEGAQIPDVKPAATVTVSDEGHGFDTAEPSEADPLGQGGTLEAVLFVKIELTPGGEWVAGGIEPYTERVAREAGRAARLKVAEIVHGAMRKAFSERAPIA